MISSRIKTITKASRSKRKIKKSKPESPTENNKKLRNPRKVGKKDQKTIKEKIKYKLN